MANYTRAVGFFSSDRRPDAAFSLSTRSERRSLLRQRARLNICCSLRSEAEAKAEGEGVGEGVGEGEGEARRGEGAGEAELEKKHYEEIRQEQKRRLTLSMLDKVSVVASRVATTTLVVLRRARANIITCHRPYPLTSVNVYLQFCNCICLHLFASVTARGCSAILA
ncbi:hypothetical protein ALC60_04881 [Trachymyrmex zeteki]|uniref:Uncharacterized protein n=1 Tax=Mycetomoellerius zeteki TaxID=64791 RepID=A0A151X7B8_9HYME|nr:hypothetical protein ALC60_04881 [Trachymyrmex zeteki]